MTGEALAEETYKRSNPLLTVFSYCSVVVLLMCKVQQHVHKRSSLVT